MKKLSVALILLSLLTACADTPPPAPKVSYSLPPKMNLDVQRIDLVDRSNPQASNSAYNMNHFQPTIDEAIHQWATDRLQAAGTVGEGEVIIRDASLTVQTLPIDHSLSAWFDRQQTSKYTARAELEFDVKGRQGFAIATAEATRYQTLPEDPTEAEKQKAYFDILNALMRDLGQNIESSIHEHMQNFIITAPVIDNGMRPMQ